MRGERIDAAGPAASVDAAGATVVDLPGTTLTPGLVEGHSHVLLHAYDETPWSDQVAHEGLALRVARATNHLRDTLLAGLRRRNAVSQSALIQVVFFRART